MIALKRVPVGLLSGHIYRASEARGCCVVWLSECAFPCIASTWNFLTSCWCAAQQKHALYGMCTACVCWVGCRTTWSQRLPQLLGLCAHVYATSSKDQLAASGLGKFQSISLHLHGCWRGQQCSAP